MKKLIIFLLVCQTLLVGFAQTKIQVDVSKLGARIQPDMYGVFFEDINFAADGGLYAELIKNRSFEFPQPFIGWTPFGKVEVCSDKPCFDRNPHYVRITNAGERLRAGLDNEGFKGIGLKKDEEYRLTFYARSNSAIPLKLSVELVNSQHENLLKKEIVVDGSAWKRYTARLKSPFTEAYSRLRMVLESEGTMDVDHVSLFPVNTWKSRENGLRADLAQALYDLKPGVFRFPGGCIIEGNTLETRYQWKNSIGPVENRPLNENRWNYTFKHKFFPDYFQTYGLGFYEYFLLSEDIGAEPLPVVSCGIACQYESSELVSLDELDPYVQDALDLIEFANGAPDNGWGKVRADMGHKAPFHLKMIGIGNEQWGAIYPERLEIFKKAIHAKYPTMKIVGSSGPNASGKHFDYLWPEMKRIGVDLVDEHYYMKPDWFFANASRYDSYDRKGPKVFAGEYASHDHASNKENNFLSALSEAAFMTGLERNADVVHLATYAPLFAHKDAWQWRPDMIWFDNLSAILTPNYYVQQLYAHHKGDCVLLTTDAEGKPIAGDNGMYATATLDKLTREIILKVVNRNVHSMKVDLLLNGMKRRKLVKGHLIYLQADNLNAINTFENANEIIPRMSQVAVGGDSLQLDVMGQSFIVYRFALSH